MRSFFPTRGPWRHVAIFGTDAFNRPVREYFKQKRPLKRGQIRTSWKAWQTVAGISIRSTKPMKTVNTVKR